ncbi:MAG: DRTGG domain-containing protein [Candidatus Thorarchaeota archaeon]
MTKNIVISGETLTGKTLVALGLAKYLSKKGKRVGYFKPIGEINDDDAHVMKQILSLKSDINSLMPIARTKTSFDEFLKVGRETLLERIHGAYTEVSENNDYMIIEGTAAPWHLLHIGLSTPQIAKELGASVICLVNFPDEIAIDDILILKALFNYYQIEDISIILNLVPPMLKTVINDKIQPYIESKGMKFLGTIYRTRELFSPNIREIAKALDGEMVVGEDKLELLIDQFMVGSMAPENALKWFRRAKDKAVITSGDRSDICLTALETDTNLLILTGGIGPDIRTLARAREVGVPIMMTAHDTYTTGTIVDSLIGSVNPDNLEKVPIIEQIILEAIDFSKIE